MKAKSKFNILLVAILGLLAVVVCMFGRTTSYLTAESEITMKAKVANIALTIMQNDRELTEEDNNIYLGTTIIEGGKAYATNVKIKSEEISASYYVRYKVTARVNGEMYNINSYITIDEDNFFLDADGWIYYGTTGANDVTTKQMLPGTDDVETTQVVETDPVILTIMQAFKIPTTAGEGKLSTSEMSGKNFQLYLYVEGSPSINFDI